MAEIISMPKLGFDMAEGTLVRWVILEGGPVSKGAILAEIETDKATVEVESDLDGILFQHLILFVVKIAHRSTSVTRALPKPLHLGMSCVFPPHPLALICEQLIPMCPDFVSF